MTSSFVEKTCNWVRRSVRLRSIFNLLLNINILVKKRDLGRWLVLELTYLGVVGGILTALLTAFSGIVIASSNTVPRPHALPILSPALEKVFMSYPQLYYGLGLHGHIITTTYMLAPGLIAAIILAYTLDPGLKRYLSSGSSYVDLIDYGLLLAVMATAAPQLLGLHRILGWLWVTVSATLGGLARRTILIALTSIYQLITGNPEPAYMSIGRDPWISDVVLMHGSRTSQS